MKIENPLAYSFIMQDDLYLLGADKELHAAYAASPQVMEAVPVPHVPVIETKQPSFKYLGENKKGFLIVVHYTGVEFMDDAHLTALTAVLTRLQYNVEDVAIFNLAKYADTTIDMLHDHFKPQRLLFLGAEALPEGIGTITLNKAQTIKGLPALFSFSFEEMMTDNERKKIFWEQMKKLY